MADIRIPLVNGEFYHVYNRGVAKRPTFLNKRDYEQTLLTIIYYRFFNTPMKLSRLKELSIDERENLLIKMEASSKPLIKIVSYVLMPNHFHFLLYQATDGGISKFLSTFANSYTKYFNTKYERVGPLFQGLFKSVRIEGDEQLLHVSRYIHLNPVISYVIKESDLVSYRWSSLPAFLKKESSFVWTDPILENFSSPMEYKKFVLDQIDYGKKLEEIKHLILED
jgi:putative transposase